MCATAISPEAVHAPVLQVLQLVSDVWQKDGLIKKTDSPFLREAARILKNSLELVTDADKQLRELLDYPLAATMAEDEKAQAVMDDNFTEVLSSGALIFISTVSFSNQSSHPFVKGVWQDPGELLRTPPGGRLALRKAGWLLWAHKAL